MMHIDLGRFSYKIEAEDYYDVKTALQEQYDKLIDNGIGLKAKCSRPLQNKITIAALWAHETIAALQEALDGHGDDQKAVVYLLCQQLVDEAYAIGRADGEARLSDRAAKARAARTSPERERAIERSISKFENANIKGSKRKAIAADLHKQGYPIQAEAIGERLKRRGQSDT